VWGILIPLFPNSPSSSQNLQGRLGYWNLSLTLSHSHLESMRRGLLVVSLLSQEPCYTAQFTAVSTVCKKTQPSPIRVWTQQPKFWGLWGPHVQYLSDLWAPRHAVLCVWDPQRRSFTHTKSHARLPSVSTSVTFFPEPFGDHKTIHVGVRTDTANLLAKTI
jgi:hypothetical protein